MLDLLKKLGVLTDDKLESVSKELDALELDKKPETRIDASRVADPQMKELIEMIQNQNAVLAEQVKSLTHSLAEEKTQRDNAMKIQQTEAKKAQDAKNAELVARALKEGKIVKAGEEQFKSFVEKDFGFAENWLKTAPVDKSFKPEAKANDRGEPAAPGAAKPANMKAYMDNRAETTQELVAALSPSKN